MTFKTFKTIIEKVPSWVRIDFSGMCEPFINAQCTNMILYAITTGHKVALYTTLLNSTERDFIRLLNVPIDPVVLHIPDKEFRCHIPVARDIYELWSRKATAYSCHGTPLYEGFNPLITYIHDRAGNGTVGDTKHHQTVNECTTDGWVVLPDGRTYLCCMDYGLEHYVGNLLTDDELKLKPKATTELCKRCINAR